jgi:hypothetical protein
MHPIVRKIGPAHAVKSLLLSLLALFLLFPPRIDTFPLVRTRLQLANLALGSLEEDSHYRALTELDTDEEFNDFRQQVETIRARCVADPYHPRLIVEVGGMLISLHADCRGTLGRFLPYVEKALTDLNSP